MPHPPIWPSDCYNKPQEDQRVCSDWQGAPAPERKRLEGTFTALVPLDAAQHTQTLFEAATAPGAEARFRYLFDEVPANPVAQHAWTEKAAAGQDPLFFAVIDKVTGRAEGRQALMRTSTAHGVTEIGSILWGPAIARTRVATEALFLMADYVFALGYRRLEWKCDNANEPSKRAAERFGFRFEGLFRQHMVVKGHNRDTAWFAITDQEWPRLRAGYKRWLAADNFGADGQQHSRLSFV